MDAVTRINLKTDCQDRRQLIQFCLKQTEQYLAIGWSYVYSSPNKISSYEDYYYAVKNSVKRVNHVLNVFWYAKENDLFWTRDLDGCYWICRATGNAQPYFSEEMDIGAILPVEAYPVGLEVPGQIKASFNRPRSGTAESIRSVSIVNYSQFIFNQQSGRAFYSYEVQENHLLENLPDFDLEELVISYLQLKENYYVLSNSIANKSTTIKIECELISREISCPRKAVVQVKGGTQKEIDALDYLPYADRGYLVYLYAPAIRNKDKVKNIIEITKEDLLSFYQEYKALLPDSIVRWEDLFHHQQTQKQ